jgi:hypothetical protein
MARGVVVDAGEHQLPAYCIPPIAGIGTAGEKHFLRLSDVPFHLAMMKPGLLLKAENPRRPSTGASNRHYQEQRTQSISKPRPSGSHR